MAWICKNEACDKFDIEATEAREVIKFLDDGTRVNSAEKCPECGSRRIDKTTPWDGSSFQSPGNKNICNK